MGYLHSWNGRDALLEGIRRETRLKSLLDPVERYHGHWESEEQRQTRERLFEDSLVSSLTVLCRAAAAVPRLSPALFVPVCLPL